MPQQIYERNFKPKKTKNKNNHKNICNGISLEKIIISRLRMFNPRLTIEFLFFLPFFKSPKNLLTFKVSKKELEFYLVYLV
jgi:hypothetical protein